LPTAEEFCITELVAGGRPTDDPKGKLLAVRLADRQLRALQARARREDVSLSEALRRCVDAWTASPSSPPAPPRRRPPTPEERETFAQVFAALGLKPRKRASH
jgi:hypothetical protein